MRNQILCGDVREQLALLPSESVHMVVTSPPYWGLRDYGVEGTLGLERTPEEYVANMVAVFGEVRRVLRKDGTLWLNLGDSYGGATGGDTRSGFNARYFGKEYASDKQGETVKQLPVRVGLKPKDLVGIPWRVAFALQADGWWLRSEITWCKTAPMPESVRDRPTSATEKVFLLSKSERYYYDQEATREPFSPSTIQRINQPSFDGQRGGDKDPLAGNRSARKALENLKQSQVGSRRNDGFNGRWDEAEAEGAIPSGRNALNYWLINPEPFSDWTESVHWERVASGESYDGTKRITSPSCPLHAGLPDSEPNDAYGEREAELLSRIERSAARRAQERRDDFVPIAPSLFEDSVDENSDSLHPSHSLAATDRSNETSKTDLALETSPAYTPSAQSPGHTDDTLALPDSVGSADRTSESRIEQDGSADHPSVQMQSHSVRKSSCTCTYLKRVTSRISHFATFPTELAKRCILAGSSEHGVCSVCGAPWRRVVEDSQRFRNNTAPRTPQGQSPRGWNAVTYKETTTLGWQPSCKHEAPTERALVLDPFMGAGTTALVALKAGRDFVGVELNPEYVAMAERRIQPYRLRLL